MLKYIFCFYPRFVLQRIKTWISQFPKDTMLILCRLSQRANATRCQKVGTLKGQGCVSPIFFLSCLFPKNVHKHQSRFSWKRSFYQSYQNCKKVPPNRNWALDPRTTVLTLRSYAFPTELFWQVLIEESLTPLFMAHLLLALDFEDLAEINRAWLCKSSKQWELAQLPPCHSRFFIIKQCWQCGH